MGIGGHLRPSLLKLVFVILGLFWARFLAVMLPGFV
jgi:hypothetical protein